MWYIGIPRKAVEGENPSRGGEDGGHRRLGREERVKVSSKTKPQDYVIPKR